uniref:Uncharacterized protein n=1 Tax=Trypanosoma vivax (strain Y486) TaxID=1055687 RepID=G0TYS8_TRYVY|nr:hypothetical protein, unlikely [Trypanosoma vivax Y486]
MSEMSKKDGSSKSDSTDTYRQAKHTESGQCELAIWQTPARHSYTSADGAGVLISGVVFCWVVFHCGTARCCCRPNRFAFASSAACFSNLSSLSRAKDLIGKSFGGHRSPSCSSTS